MNNFHKLTGYQIYPKSFADSNGDGIGDIKGIIEKLDYIKKLGVDFIWINPIYKSPQVDGGYDIADFYAIDEMFGTLADFKKLLKAAHERDLKILLDLVVNHTSDQHPWFIESKKSKDNPYRDYYHWQDATPDTPPNNWKSFFGGSTWTYDKKSKQSYFHVFAKEQPDLNWRNPKLREEIYKMVRWWLELGIDGFRLDAISHIQKAPWDFKIKSWKGNDPWQPFMNVEGIDDYMLELKAIFDEYGALTVGEASGVLSSEASSWTGEGGYVNMLFELEHNARKSNGNGQGSVYGYKKVIMRWQKDMQAGGGWQAVYLENHDQPRVIDTFGDGTIASAKALAVSYMLLRGTPFIYQGQEIGMTNFPFTDIKQTDAAEIERAYKEELAAGLSKKEALAKVTKNARDNSRTPMQWNAKKNAGFTTGKPWFVINPNYKTVNVEKATELTELYKALIALRHEEEAISDGKIKFLFESHPTALVYERDNFLIVCNLGAKKAHLTLPKKYKKYKAVIASKEHEIAEKMVFDGWEYQVYKA